jgi:hypothetical protein
MRYFQWLCSNWVTTRFSKECFTSLTERVSRVLEESTELAQSEGLTHAQAVKIVNYVYGREIGEPHQEAAGTAFTLLTYAEAKGLDLEVVLRDELDRVYALPEDHFRKKWEMKKASGVSMA